MSKSKKTVPVQGDAADFLKRAETAASQLGWDIKEKSGNKLVAASGFNMITLLGEKITVEVAGKEAKIVSRTKNPLLITAWGKNTRNINNLLENM